MSNDEKKVIVSACLAGIECRYDCAHQERLDIVKLVVEGKAIPVCPEQLGGLPTPRKPAEIQKDGSVKTIDAVDVTKEYNRGAQEAFKILSLLSAEEAYLKSKSPMCGSGKVYNGNFTGDLIPGDGVFAKLLKARGIKIHSID